MHTATLTPNGRLTIPIEVRRALKIETGDRVEFVQIAHDRYELFAITGEVTALKGMFGTAKKKVSIKSMNAVIKDMA